MNPTLNTILNSAPLIIQGASRLVKLIRHRENERVPDQDPPDTVTGIKGEVERLHRRLDTNDESNIEQIKLIEELAKQNELLAAQLKSTIRHLHRISLFTIVLLIISVSGIIISLR